MSSSGSGSGAFFSGFFSGFFSSFFGASLTGAVVVVATLFKASLQTYIR
jgi:hypothetical protein